MLDADEELLAEVDAVVQRAAANSLMANPEGVTLSEDGGEVVSHSKPTLDVGNNTATLSKNWVNNFVAPSKKLVVPTGLPELPELVKNDSLLKDLVTNAAIKTEPNAAIDTALPNAPKDLLAEKNNTLNEDW